jgi:hypothetical protein
MRGHVLVSASVGVAVVLGVVSSASAASVVAVQNQEVVVPVNGELGSVLQFSSAVKTVTPAKSFAVSDLGTEGNSTGQKTDVRTFQVKPVEAGANESVTFVLAGGRSVSLRLVATPNAEKFYDVSLAVKRTKLGTKFLASELEMMRSMIADESGGFAREVLDTKVNAEVGKLDVRLVRVYSAPELTGYVFSVANAGGKSMNVDLSTFAVGEPNRAVLASVNRPRLESCPLLGTNPKCTATLHFVVRGVREVAPVLTLTGKPAPYVKSESALQGGEQ